MSVTVSSQSQWVTRPFHFSNSIRTTKISTNQIEYCNTLPLLEFKPTTLHWAWRQATWLSSLYCWATKLENTATSWNSMVIKGYQMGMCVSVGVLKKIRNNFKKKHFQNFIFKPPNPQNLGNPSIFFSGLYFYLFMNII